MNFKKGIKLYLRSLPDLSKKSDIEDDAGGEDTGKEYRFSFSYLTHVTDREKIYLRIQETTGRNLEGRPLYPEQEQWIRSCLKIYKINAEEIWFSHWKFETDEDAEKFVELLQKFDAVQK